MRQSSRFMLLALAMLLVATACSSRPRKTLKYRKKGCNCPSWGQAPTVPMARPGTRSWDAEPC